MSHHYFIPTAFLKPLRYPVLTFFIFHDCSASESTFWHTRSNLKFFYWDLDLSFQKQIYIWQIFLTANSHPFTYSNILKSVTTVKSSEQNPKLVPDPDQNPEFVLIQFWSGSAPKYYVSLCSYFIIIVIHTGTNTTTSIQQPIMNILYYSVGSKLSVLPDKPNTYQIQITSNLHFPLHHTLFYHVFHEYRYILQHII